MFERGDAQTFPKQDSTAFRNKRHPRKASVHGRNVEEEKEQ